MRPLSHPQKRKSKSRGATINKKERGSLPPPSRFLPLVHPPSGYSSARFLPLVPAFGSSSFWFLPIAPPPPGSSLWFLPLVPPSPWFLLRPGSCLWFLLRQPLRSCSSLANVCVVGGNMARVTIFSCACCLRALWTPEEVRGV